MATPGSFSRVVIKQLMYVAIKKLKLYKALVVWERKFKAEWWNVLVGFSGLDLLVSQVKGGLMT